MPELLDSVPTSIGNYPGTLNHFRAAIARIQRIYWAGYEANDGMLFYFGRQDDDGPACSVWQIRASNGFGIDDHAELVATENPDGTCTVDLHDNSEAFAPPLERPTYGIGRFWEWLWQEIHATEPLNDHADSGHYLFCKRGDYWELAFDSESFLLRDLRGLGYIHVLLSHPDEDITPEDVEAMADGEHPRRLEDPDRPLLDRGGKTKGLGEYVQDGLDTKSLHVTDYDRDDGDTLIDAQGLEAVRAELTRVEEEIANADPYFGISEELLERKGKLESFISSVVGKGDRLRVFEGTDDAARKRVGKAIRDAIGAVKANNEGMGNHLDKSIQTPSGYRSRYAPEDPVDWTLE